MRSSIYSQDNLRPFLVNEKEDTMCFSISSLSQLPETATKSFNFILNPPSSTKVNNNIYDYIDDTVNFDSSVTDINVFFVTNSTFNHIDAGSIKTISDHIFTLQQYNLGTFDHFFWTSTLTQLYFSKQDSSDQLILKDKIRANRWIDLSNYFKVNSLDSTSDPCDISHMTVIKREVG